MITKKLFAMTANWFGNHDGISPNRTVSAMQHDAVHAAINAGVTLEEEELVLNTFSALVGDRINPDLADRVESAIASIDPEILMELIDFLMMPTNELQIFGF